MKNVYRLAGTLLLCGWMGFAGQAVAQEFRLGYVNPDRVVRDSAAAKAA